MKRTYDLKDYLEIKFASATSFSPDGKKVSIISNLTGTSQLYLIGTSGEELKQLTSDKDSVSFSSFSPTENKIMFGMADGGDENTQFFLYDIESNDTIEITKKKNCKFQWGGWSRDGKYISYSSNERNGTDFDVYIKKIQTGISTCVFEEGGRCSSYGFSPSGKYLAVSKVITNVSNNLYLIDLNSGEKQSIASGADESQNGAPRWLPTEDEFFYVSNVGRDFLGLCSYSMLDKKSQYVLTRKWDIESTRITRDGRFIAIQINEEGYKKLAIYTTKNLKTISRQDLPKGTYFSFGWSSDGKHLLVNASGPTTSLEPWIWSREKNKSVRLIKNPCSVPKSSFVEPKLIHYTSFDGLDVPALIYKPKDLSPDKKLPVIINIHGGPEMQARPTFDSLTQYFVSSGYAVIFPNVRGSSGYGKKYLHLDDVEKRMDSVADIAALHSYLSKDKSLDENRAALMGGSYGGFMVLASLAFYPDLWAAGVDIVGIANYVTFLENTSAYRRANRESEYGSLKKDKKLLESISPYNFVDQIRAPLLIIHGKNDPRVPLSEAEQMYEKLKKQGKQAELLIYPDEGHGLAKLKNRLDAYPKIVDFLDSVLK